MKKETIRDVENSVIRTYKKVNPSTYNIDVSSEEFAKRKYYMENLFIRKINFPPKMFDRSTFLEFGSGTGEHSLFFLLWGGCGTFVEANNDACNRAAGLFKKFAPDASFEIVNKSLFDFSTNDKYDIVISHGVIHHTADKRKAFDNQCSFVKPGGFTVLGIGNTAGLFQRNLMRLIVYTFAAGDEEIEKVSELLFPDFLDRAEKYGRRSRKAIIYDNLVLEKDNPVTAKEFCSWLSENGMEFYSSWPPVRPAFMSDSVNHPYTLLERYPHIFSIGSLAWATHDVADSEDLAGIDSEIAKNSNSIDALTVFIDDVVPGHEINLDHLEELAREAGKIEFSSEYWGLFYRKWAALCRDVQSISMALKKRDLDATREIINKSSQFLKGGSGIGMTYWVGHRPQ